MRIFLISFPGWEDRRVLNFENNYKREVKPLGFLTGAALSTVL